MGRWAIGGGLALLGWAATLIMGLCVIGMLYFSLQPFLVEA